MLQIREMQREDAENTKKLRILERKMAENEALLKSEKTKLKCVLYQLQCTHFLEGFYCEMASLSCLKLFISESKLQGAA